jgi:glycosyltransferase involved in cell wall biosynthesis
MGFVVMTSPLISIVTSNFNQGRYLRQLFACIAFQKRDFIEFVVVDGGSSDESHRLIGQAGSLIDQLEAGPDKGPADGWRRGLALARGEFVLFVNGDDALLPNAIERIKNVIEADRKTDIFVGHGLIVDERILKSKLFYSHNPRFKSLVRGIGAVCQQSTLIRRSAFPQINIENRTCWDSEILIDALAQGASAKRIEDVWGVFRVTDMSISGRARTFEQNQRYKADRVKIANKHGIGDTFGVEPLRVNFGRAQRYLDPCYYMLRNNFRDLERIRTFAEIWPA